MVDINYTSTTYVADQTAWLGSQAGTDSILSITVDMSLGFSGSHYPDGFLLSGLPLGRNATTGLYGLYNDAATDGRQVCRGFLYPYLPVPKKNPSTAKLMGNLLWQGRVKLNRIPIALDAAGQSDIVGRFLLDYA